MKRLKTAVITEIVNVMAVHSKKGITEKINKRPWYGLSFCTEGQITYTHNGKSFVSDPSHAIILPQDSSYTLSRDRDGVFPLINFFCKDKLCDTFIEIPIDDTIGLVKDFEKIKSLIPFEENHSKIMSIFYDILHHITTQKNMDTPISPALRYIEKNYHKPGTTNKILARECNISEVYLRKLFLKEFNTTPKQYILDVRLQKSKYLLSEGILKINAVAEQCGFSNPYHFCRIFKERIGMTPTEYMIKNKISKI